METKTGGNPQDIRQGAKHTLFVEGTENSFDVKVIQKLLDKNELGQIRVETMGGCDNVRSAAQALIQHHPDYYFLIDRDDQSDETVTKSWGKFPNPAEYNMIIWRKRELENYFIDPEYLKYSSYIKSGSTIADIKEYILKKCNERLFFDAANLTILSLNRQLQQRPLNTFRNPDEFISQQDGLSQLVQLGSIEKKLTAIANLLQQNNIEQIYENFINELSSGQTPLQYNCGNWLFRMTGKEIFHSMATQYFQVISNTGILQGAQQREQIALQLVKLPLAQQPDDFQELVNLLRQRLASS